MANKDRWETSKQDEKCSWGVACKNMEMRDVDPRKCPSPIIPAGVSHIVVTVPNSFNKTYRYCGMTCKLDNLVDWQKQRK